MPDAAAALPELAHGQAHEAVAARLEAHPFEQLAGCALAVAALGGAAAQLLELTGEPVAGPLELTQIQQPRPAPGGLGGGRLKEGKALSEDAGAVALQPGDLLAQHAPGGTLGVVGLSL